jgi:hypothetical protein
LFHLIKALSLSQTLDVVQTIAPKGSVAALESLANEIEKINFFRHGYKNRDRTCS